MVNHIEKATLKVFVVVTYWIKSAQNTQKEKTRRQEHRRIQRYLPWSSTWKLKRIVLINIIFVL